MRRRSIVISDYNGATTAGRSGGAFSAYYAMLCYAMLCYAMLCYGSLLKWQEATLESERERFNFLLYWLLGDSGVEGLWLLVPEFVSHCIYLSPTATIGR